MPARIRMVAGNIYHVLNRGVDGRTIFSDDADYRRFIHDLFEFNDANPSNNVLRHFNTKKNDFGSPIIQRAPRKLLVELLVFVLMPNHYHLLLIPKTDESIRQFISKLNIGYAQYFNQRNERKGTLFQGRYKAVPVTRDEHLLHLPFYIHCNPLDLAVPDWRKQKIRSLNEAMQFLEHYRWSSFLDYIGKKNFPSVTQREFLEKFLGQPKQYKRDIAAWLRTMEYKQQDISIFE